MKRKEERVVKNGRLTISLPEYCVEVLNEVGEKMKEETGVEMSYPQIVVALVHKYKKQGEQ